MSFFLSTTAEIEDRRWMERAACADKPREWFFPERGQSTRRAIAVCRTCPVVAECVNYADRTGTQYGVWGGVIRKRAKDAEEHPDEVIGVTEVTEISVIIVDTAPPPEPPETRTVNAPQNPLRHRIARL